MTLNKSILALGIAASLSVVSSLAMASDNTITFQGEVTDETCSVTVNGNDAAPVVLLPTVSASALAAVADIAGQATFDVGVTGCTGVTGVTDISTVFVGNQVTSAGNLGNTGTATNVDVQIVDTTDTVIDFTSGFKATGDLSAGLTDGSATATYTAQYYATGAATAGTVQASLQYTVSYL